MRILKLLVLMAVFAVLPRAAQAQGGFLDFMENLSGPGPSHGFTTTWRGFCVDENNKVIPCLDDSRSGIKGVMRFETSLPYLTTGDNQRFADTPLDTRTIHAKSFGATYFVRIDPVLDIGVGIGGLFFSADDFDTVKKITFTPIDVAIVPFARTAKNPGLARLLRIEFRETLVGWSLSAREFGPNTSTYSKGTEFVRSVLVGADVGAILFKSK